MPKMRGLPPARLPFCSTSRATASIAVHGGAPGLRDRTLLEPEMTVDKFDALVLSDGSVFGLDAMGGVAAFLREQGRGFAVGNARCRSWRVRSSSISSTAATRPGAGLGSASTISPSGFRVGVLVAVNALGQATIGAGPHFWAAPQEQNGEFGGRGWPQSWPKEALRMKGDAAENTTIGIVATDASLSKAEAKRLAVMAQDGIARELRPAHAALDGDTVFAVATGTALEPPSLTNLTEIGTLAADCLARAIARAVFDAEALSFNGALPRWKGKFANS
jgi:L-aminopeptidase/D-esterase-like protein